MVKTIINQVLCIILSVVFSLVALDFVLTGSDVYWSYSEDRCISVENYDGMFFDAGDYTCENLPPRYTNIWVK